MSVTFHLFVCLVASPSSSLCLSLYPFLFLVPALYLCLFSPSLCLFFLYLSPSPSPCLHLFLLQKMFWLLIVTEKMGVVLIALQGCHLSFSSCSTN